MRSVKLKGLDNNVQKGNNPNIRLGAVWGICSVISLQVFSQNSLYFKKRYKRMRMENVKLDEAYSKPH